MKLKYVCSMITLIATLFVGLMPHAKASPTNYGPRSDLSIFFYSSGTPLYAALKAGSVDIMAWELTATQYDDAILDPNIQIMRVPRYDFRCWSLNNNQTISKYPGVDSIMSHPEFRKALWCLTEVGYYTEVICRGFAEPLYVTVAAESGTWMNQDVIAYVKTYYKYDPVAADAFLDNADIKDHDGDGIRNYPHGWPGAGDPPKNLDPVVFYARSDDPLRYGASVHLKTQMERPEIGIPVDFKPADMSTCNVHVMGARNYHIYSAGWSVGRFPTYQYGWFHSSRWLPYGSNYHVSKTTGKDRAIGPGTDWQAIDAAVEKVWYPPDYDTAITACQQSQVLTSQQYACVIPMWSSTSFFGYRNLLGVCNVHGVGPENAYTYLNAKRIDDPSQPIRVGLHSAPVMINQIYSRWVWDASVGSVIYGDGQGYQFTHPYNRMIDQPWALTDWELSTWDSGTKSKITYWFRDGIEWIKPGPTGGTIIRPYDISKDYEYNAWYFASEPAGWIYTAYADIHHIRTYPAEKKVVVYMDALSYWSQYWPWGRDIFRDNWQTAPLARLIQPPEALAVLVKGTNASTPGPLTALKYLTKDAPVEIVEIKVDGVLLTEANEDSDNDYEIVKDRIHIYKTGIPDGAKIELKYWARGDCAGYWPGGLTYETTTATFGMDYMTSYKAGVGGYATYKANREYFMETPPWGEVDFKWYWNDPQPPNPPRTIHGGYFIVDLFDVTMGTAALGSQGFRIPDPTWQPGADLSTMYPPSPYDRGDCYINYWDVAEIVNDYDLKWGISP